MSIDVPLRVAQHVAPNEPIYLLSGMLFGVDDCGVGCSEEGEPFESLDNPDSPLVAVGVSRDELNELIVDCCCAFGFAFFQDPSK